MRADFQAIQEGKTSCILSANNILAPSNIRNA